MDLPNELIGNVVSHLEHIDLKSVRLVSKTWSAWSACASEHLFEKFYISPQEEDLRAIDAMTNNTRLRGCVRILECDAVHFSPDITQDEYMEGVVCSLSNVALNYTDKDSLIPNFEGPGSQTNAFVSMFRGDSAGAGFYEIEDDSTKILTLREHFSFVRAGYQSWMDRANHERMVMDNNTFRDKLLHAFDKFRKVDTVILNGKWQDYWPRDKLVLGKSRSGSILRRSWDPFQYCSPEWEPGVPSPKFSTQGAIAFWAITEALIGAERRIRKL